MYAWYIMKRTQIYLPEDQDRRLGRRARATGQTKSELIRQAIQRFLSRDEEPSELERRLLDTGGALPDIEIPSRAEWDSRNA